MAFDNEGTIFDVLEAQATDAKISEEDRTKFRNAIEKMRNQKLNLMITGATGSGKSSTINALFGANVAKVGVGTNPETMDIKKFELKNLILWDSPGLGDGKEADARHSKNIINKLKERGADGKALIDLVLVILDGSTRDYGTSYTLINDVIIPNLGSAEDKKNRILVAINQCDVAMKGKNWDYDLNAPEPALEDFLDKKVQSVQKRIKDSTGVDIEPIYYSAGYKEVDGEEQHPYNLAKLLYFIIEHTPNEKRAIYVDNTSKVESNWSYNQTYTPPRSTTRSTSSYSTPSRSTQTTSTSSSHSSTSSYNPSSYTPSSYQDAVKESVTEGIVNTVVKAGITTAITTAIGALIAGPVGGMIGKGLSAIGKFLTRW